MKTFLSALSLRSAPHCKPVSPQKGRAPMGDTQQVLNSVLPKTWR